MTAKREIMNGFVVFESSAAAERFLQHRAAMDACASGTFTQSSNQPHVMTFRNLPEEDVPRLQELIAQFGGELQASRRYETLG